MVDNPLSRESILRGNIRKMAEARPGIVRLMTDEDRQQWIDKTLAEADSLEQIWIFAYGSLIWNPAFRWVERRRCVVPDYHRSFCFWTKLGRGDPENPGLMLALEPGGQCSGVAYRIAASELQSELDILFRRELMSYAYIPTWTPANDVTASTLSATDVTQLDETTAGRYRVLGFVMDSSHERYCADLPRNKMLQHIASANGPLGRNCDYLFELVNQLQKLDLVDHELLLLAQEVRDYQRQHSIPPSDIPAPKNLSENS